MAHSKRILGYFLTISCCASISGCFSIDDYINIIEKEPPEPGDVFDPDENPDIPEQGDNIHPGGSGGVENGDDGDSNDQPGKVEEPVSLSLEFISPSTGDVHGGYEVRVRGTALDETGIVRFGTLQSPQQIFVNDKVVRAIVPAGKQGCVDVSWTQAGETHSVKNGFCYVQNVAIDAVTPNVAVAGQPFFVTLSGQGFDDSTRVAFSNGSASWPLLDPRVESDTVMSGWLPAMEAGEIDVSIANAHSSAYSDDALRLLPELQVLEFSPHVVKTGQPAAIALSGHGLSSDLKISVGGISVSPDIVSEHEGSFITPDLDAGTYDLLVYDAYRQVRFKEAVHYVQNEANAALLSVSPDFGNISGGERIELHGVGLPLSGNAFFGESLATVMERNATRWVVTAPPHAQGVTSVAIGDATIDKAYEYIDYPSATAILPDKGRGGTTAVLTGTGFDENLRVFVGSYEATNIEVNTPTQATIEIPSGFGRLPIVVQQGRARVETTVMFQYDADVEITGLSTEQVSVAGGTKVQIFGGLFDRSMTLTVDGKGVEYTLENPNCLSFMAPAHDAGEVVLTLTCAQGEACGSASLTYFDPTGVNTSASGGAIDGTLHVTVLTVDTAVPIPEATVFLGSNPASAIVGTTDANGHVTFSNPEIRGDQTVVACAPEHSCNTLQPVNAQNITLFLEDWRANDASEVEPEPTPPPQNDAINPIDVVVEYPPSPAYFTGTVGDFGKVELVSNPNHVRAGIVMQSSLSPYSLSYDKDDVYFLTEPGASYRLKARSGDVALALVCGIYDTSTQEFFPKYLGVKRHQFVTNGARIQNHLDCDLPLNQVQNVKMLNAPLKSGPNIVKASAYIFVGDEGYIGGFMGGISETDLVAVTQIPPFRNALQDASLALTVGAYTNGGYPASVFYKYHVIPSDTTLEVGPAAPIPVLVTPSDEDILSTGRLAWSVEYPQNVDFYALTMRMYSSQNNGDLLYQIYLPGTATSAEFPTVYSWPDDKSGMLYIQLTAYKSVREGFDFNLFSTAELRYNYIHSSAYVTRSFQNPKNFSAAQP